MKASSRGRVRPTILFSQTPHSVARRAREISNRTAAELLRLLCEQTVGFGRGFIDLTYRALAVLLSKDWSTVARAAKLLRKRGDVVAEALHDGSYRWYVLLEPEDVKSDPQGIYRLRSSDHTPHGVGAMGGMATVPGGHGVAAMGGMAATPWGPAVDQGSAKPVLARGEASSEEALEAPLKIDLKDTDTKIDHQRDDDEPLGHKRLLQEMLELGTGQRMARKLLREHDHELVSRTLAKIRLRPELDNKAGYLVQEVRDGGYAEIVVTERPSLGAVPAGSHGVERTRAEQEALEAERERRELAYRNEVKVLLERFEGLARETQLELKECWTRGLERMVPRTSRRAELLQNSVYQKLAFKETVTRFFKLLDLGLSPGGALERLRAAEV